MALCDLCQSFDVLDVPKISPEYNIHSVTSRVYPSLVTMMNKHRKEDQPQSSEPLGLPYHKSTVELEAASAANCAICTVVQRDVAQFHSEYSEAKKDTSDHRARSAGPDWKMFVVQGRSDTGGFMVVSADAEDWSRVWVVAAVGFCVDYNDPLTSIIRGRKILSSSEHTLRHALSWVRDCDKQRTNKRCHVDTAPLPARVLVIGSSKSQSITLYEPTEGELGRYAALSYVWGESSPYATTRTNIEANKKGIDVEKLPKTFQDATFVAREMGIGYLWIDALCICQDDSSDWSREASRMSSVYSNAYIMLSATGSPSSTSGLSILASNRPAPTYSPFAYTATTSGMKGTLQAFSASREANAFGPWSANSELLKNEPLSQRGWALQERWLAPRILHFGSKQMFFECYCGFKSEEGFYMEGRKDTLFPTTSQPSPPPSSTDQIKPGTDRTIPITETEPIHQQWSSILHTYSRRLLTHPSDKLPALSGLARTYQTITSDTYLAGFWQKTLLQNLIWQAVGKGPTASTSYRAPSWSWAAIDGGIGMFNPGVGFDEGEWSSLATLHSAHITLKNEENPFGEVSAGELVLSAPLECIYPFEGDLKEGEEWPKNHKAAKVKGQGGGSEDYNFAIFDSSKHAEGARDRKLWVAVLWRHKIHEENKDLWKSKEVYHGIVVARVEGKQDVYERLGKIPFADKDLGECEWMSDGSVVDRFTLV